MEETPRTAPAALPARERILETAYELFSQDGVRAVGVDRIVAEGVRYTQMHTTALCSPTRSCLLTGRNHTRNSMACITEAAIGFPNASGVIPPSFGSPPAIQ